MKPVLISVCIPTYCRYKLLVRALNSVLNQNFASLEIIISDNASPDDSWLKTQRLSELDQRIVVSRNQTNLGWTGNINECIKVAQGEFLVFLCDDDELLPGMLRLESEFLQSYPSVGFVHSAAETISITGKRSLNKAATPFFLKGGIEALTETALSFQIIFSSVMVRKSCFDRLGCFVESISADYEMWSRIATQYDIGYIDRPLIRYYGHSISPRMAVNRYISESEKLGNMVSFYFPEEIRESLDFRSKSQQQLANGLRSLGIQCFQIGDWKRGLAFLMAARQRSPAYSGQQLAKDLVLAIPRRIKFLIQAKHIHSTAV